MQMNFSSSGGAAVGKHFNCFSYGIGWIEFDLLVFIHVVRICALSECVYLINFIFNATSI